MNEHAIDIHWPVPLVSEINSAFEHTSVEVKRQKNSILSIQSSSQSTLTSFFINRSKKPTNPPTKNNDLNNSIIKPPIINSKKIKIGNNLLVSGITQKLALKACSSL